MDILEKSEKDLAKWLDHVPHLPTKLRRLIAMNFWWVVVIGVLIGIIFLLAMLAGVFLYFAVALLPIQNVLNLGWVAPLAAFSFAFLLQLVVKMICMTMAIQSLYRHEKKGWRILFAGSLAGLAAGIAVGLVSMSLSAIALSLVAVAIELYVLFEVRMYFTALVPKTGQVPGESVLQEKDKEISEKVVQKLEKNQAPGSSAPRSKG